MAIVLLIFLFLFTNSKGEEITFNVKQHLSTVTRYGTSKGGRNSNHASAPPDGCIPIHLNLVARHGTRAPTTKRIKELNNLENELKKLLGSNVGNDDHLFSLPSWLKDWKSPWAAKINGGELIPEGEKELYDLGIRTRKLFSDLFSDPYNSDIYTIKATQVARASASAVAFGMGLFSGNGNLGSDRHRAFSVVTESRANDTMLRFFDRCHKYEDYKKRKKPKVKKLIKDPVLDDITKSLTARYGLNFTQNHTSTLWFLCKQVALLEWMDDTEVFKLKGYGSSLNYRMGVHLLTDIVNSMDNATKARERKQVPGTYEKASFRFSHAETLIPFTCLLGLFLEDEEDFKHIQNQECLELPPRPPATRNWKVSDVAPFAGNNMLVLYSCHVANSSDEYFVRVLHNEEPIAMPGCDGSDFCSFEKFKNKIVAPHVKYDFHTLCNVNKEESLVTPKPNCQQEHTSSNTCKTM
ncbi:hypothetical protein Csa_005827 [Cucumis sativus]|nr:hypothetical protein Csa_005827 [Cucumis sativus]